MTTPLYWPKAKKHLSASDPVMKRLIATYHGEALTSRGDAFFTLARSIVGQQISVKAADSVWKKLVHHGATERDDIARLPDEALRACGLSGQKVAYMRALCAYFETPRDFSAMSDEEAISELITIKGIGRWTAEMFLIFHLLRPNVLPLDDIGLQKAIYRHYFEGEKVEKKRLSALGLAWEPYRSVATWYLWRSLDPVPVEY
jgi:DNA-3-methyladenine glycosylase II